MGFGKGPDANHPPQMRLCLCRHTKRDPAAVSGHLDGSIYRFYFDDGTGSAPSHAKLVVHPSIPYALAWGEAIAAAGSNRSATRHVLPLDKRRLCLHWPSHIHVHIHSYSSSLQSLEEQRPNNLGGVLSSKQIICQGEIGHVRISLTQVLANVQPSDNAAPFITSQSLWGDLFSCGCTCKENCVCECVCDTFDAHVDRIF